MNIKPSYFDDENDDASFQKRIPSIFTPEMLQKSGKIKRRRNKSNERLNSSLISVRDRSFQHVFANHVSAIATTMTTSFKLDNDRDRFLVNCLSSRKKYNFSENFNAFLISAEIKFSM